MSDYHPRSYPARYLDVLVDIPAGTGYAIPYGFTAIGVFCTDADTGDLRFRIGGAGRYAQNDVGVNWVGVVNAWKAMPIKLVSDGASVMIWNLGANAVSGCVITLEN